MATDALADGFDELMWIDTDVAFEPRDVERLRSHGLPLCCGIYAKKGPRRIAAHVLPGTRRIMFGEGGGLVEIQYAPGGFLHVRREVLETIATQLALPICNERFGRPMVPYFAPMVHTDEKGPWYLSEDFAFCQRVRQCGFRIVADTTIRLWHLGTYRYGWEDACGARQRQKSFTMHFGTLSDPPEESRAVNEQ